MNEEELLLHFGVKGMKWGVRRSRTSKGSVTKRFGESAKDYGKTYKKTVKDSFVNSKSQTKAELQLLKEKPRTALYRNKEDLKRLNQLTSENVAAKKERNAKVASKVKDYAKVAGTATKDGIKNPIASDKAARQLMKEKPMTALYRNKNDLKRLNQLTAENVAAKKAKVEASKSYKEAQKNKKSEAKRKNTSDKVKDGINTKLSKSDISSAALETALSMGVGALAAKTLGYNPTIGAGIGLGIDILTDNKKR